MGRSQGPVMMASEWHGDDDGGEFEDGEGMRAMPMEAVEAGAAVDGVEETAGEEFEDGRADEELDDGVGREADVEFESDDGDAP